MNRVFLTAFVVFASVMLLSQAISSAEGKYSEARKNAEIREEQLLKKEKGIQIKKFNPSATANTISKLKTQKEVDAINASYLTELNNAKADLKQAKEDLNLANRAYLRDNTSSIKKQEVENAEMAVKAAENKLQVVLLNKP